MKKTGKTFLFFAILVASAFTYASEQAIDIDRIKRNHQQRAQEICTEIENSQSWAELLSTLNRVKGLFQQESSLRDSPISSAERLKSVYVSTYDIIKDVYYNLLEDNRTLPTYRKRINENIYNGNLKNLVLLTCGDKLSHHNKIHFGIYEHHIKERPSIKKAKAEKCVNTYYDALAKLYEARRKPNRDSNAQLEQYFEGSFRDSECRVLDAEILFPYHMLLENGEQALADYLNGNQQYLNGTKLNFQRWIAEAEKAVHQAREYKTRIEAQRIEISENKAKQEAENKRVAEEIRKGNYKAARSCRELSAFLVDKADQQDKSRVYAQPTNRIHHSFGRLIELKDNTGYIVDTDLAGQYYGAEIILKPNTIWIGKDKTQINEVVYFLGRYVANSKINFQVGSEKRTIPVKKYELICIQPNRL